MPLPIKHYNRRRQPSSFSNSSGSSSNSKIGKNLKQVLDPEELSDRLLQLSSALFQKGVIKDYQLVKVIEKNSKSPFRNLSPNESFEHNDDLPKNETLSKEAESGTETPIKQEKLDTCEILVINEQKDVMNNISEATTSDEKICFNFGTFSNENVVESSEIEVLQTIHDQEITMFGSTFGTETYNCINGSVKTLGSEVTFTEAKESVAEQVIGGDSQETKLENLSNQTDAQSMTKQENSNKNKGKLSNKIDTLMELINTSRNIKGSNQSNLNSKVSLLPDENQLQKSSRKENVLKPNEDLLKSLKKVQRFIKKSPNDDSNLMKLESHIKRPIDILSKR